MTVAVSEGSSTSSYGFPALISYVLALVVYTRILLIWTSRIVGYTARRYSTSVYTHETHCTVVLAFVAFWGIIALGFDT